MFNIHFLYPLWLWLVPLGLIAFLAGYGLGRDQQQAKNWHKIVDKSLQPFVIVGANKHNKRNRVLFYFVAGLVAVVALSGPSLHKENVPLYENHQGSVIALDLSASMLAEDVKPSRIQRAKLALIDLLKPHIQKGEARQENQQGSRQDERDKANVGYVGLVVFAADAFTVAPLTNDVETLIAQLTHMSPAIMPAQGSRLDKAITQSVSLLVNSGYSKGDILLVTDGLSDLDETRDAAHSANKQGFNVSVLAVGTAAGASIPFSSPVSRARNKQDQVLLDKQGKAVIATLDRDALKSVAVMGVGSYLDLNSDVNVVTTLLSQQSVTLDGMTAAQTVGGRNAENWVNAGIWLLFPLLFMVLYLFRGGLIWLLCLMVLLPVDPVYAFDWNSLWLNQQQQAKQWLDKGDAVKAEQWFDDHQWKAIAAYRAKNYPLAVQFFAEQDNAKAWYNRGNALFQMKQLTAAIRAYETVLEKQPEHADARYNLQLAQQVLLEKKDKPEYANAEPQETDVLQNEELTADSSQQQDIEQQGIEQDIQQGADAERADLDRGREQQAFEKQWLKSVPDDPSGLWRRKFKYQYNKRSQQSEAQPW